MSWSRLDDGWESFAELIEAGGWQPRFMYTILLSRAGARGGVLSDRDLAPGVLAHLSGARPEDCASGVAALQEAGLLARGSLRQRGGRGGARGVEGWLLRDWQQIRRQGDQSDPERDAPIAPLRSGSPRHGPLRSDPGREAPTDGRTDGENERFSSAASSPRACARGRAQPAAAAARAQAAAAQEPENVERRNPAQSPALRSAPTSAPPAAVAPTPSWDWHACWQSLGGRGLAPPPIQAPLWAGLAEYASSSPEQRAETEHLVARAASAEHPLRWLLSCLDEEGHPLPAPATRGRRRQAEPEIEEEPEPETPRQCAALERLERERLDWEHEHAENLRRAAAVIPGGAP